MSDRPGTRERLHGLGLELAETRAEVARLKSELKEFAEHEEQTHIRLGAVLGIDDDLEVKAKELRANLESARQRIETQVGLLGALEKERDAARSDLEALRADYDRLAQVIGTTKVCETCRHRQWHEHQDVCGRCHEYCADHNGGCLAWEAREGA